MSSPYVAFHDRINILTDEEVGALRAGMKDLQPFQHRRTYNVEVGDKTITFTYYDLDRFGDIPYGQPERLRDLAPSDPPR